MASGGIIGRLRVVLGLDKEAYETELKKTKAKTKTFADDTVSQLKGIGAGMVAAFSVGAIGSFLKESAELSAKLQGVKSAYDKINNPNLLNDLRKATKNTVDDLQLMQTAVKAQNFKIPLENLATLLSFATQRAKETGEAADYLVESIILGIGRKSPLILDNLGISALEVREEFAKTGDMAQAVANIIEREMPEAANATGDAAIATGQLSAAWTNFKLAVGDGSLGSAWAEFKKELAETLSLATEFAQTDTGKVLSETIKGISLSPFRIDTSWAENIKKATTEGAKLSDTIGAIAKEAETSVLKTTKEIEKLSFDKVFSENTLQAIDEQISALEDLKQVTIDLEQHREIALQLADLEARKKAIEGIYASEEKSLKINKEKTVVDKQGLEYKEKEVKLSLESLSKQEELYGETLVFLNEKLSLTKQLIDFAKTDTERKQLAGITAELEKQIELKQKNAAVTVGSSISLTPMSVGGFEDPIASTFDTGLDQSYALELEKAQNFVSDMNSILESGVESAVSGFGAAIGNVLAGNYDDAWMQLLEPVAQMVVQFGELLIAYGVSMEAFKNAFANPWAAIGAGIALVAIGSAISAYISKSSSGGSSSTASGNTFTGGYSNAGILTSSTNVGSSGSYAPKVIVEGRISGDDILLSSQRASYRKSR